MKDKLYRIVDEISAQVMTDTIFIHTVIPINLFPVSSLMPAVRLSNHPDSQPQIEHVTNTPNALNCKKPYVIKSFGVPPNLIQFAPFINNTLFKSAIMVQMNRV